MTKEKLELASKAENLLHVRGMGYVRVRIHDNIARIEVEKENFNQVISDETLVDEMKALGFDFVTLDLKGISSGSFDK